LDDFQIYTPTDTIGQHIHLVKFDVTSSDGSGNGWNYEDGTYSPDEVRERVFAYNRWAHSKPGKQLWILKTHPLFGGGKPEESCKFKTGDKAEEARCAELMAKGQCPSREEQLAWPWGNEEAMKKHAHHLATTAPLCGAQRTVQRWWADPILDTSNRAKGKKGENYKPELGQDKDFTLRTVFTHDHFGASSHQQHGLYAALVVEPANSVWLNLQSSSIASWTGTQAMPYADVEKSAMGGADLSANVGPKELRAPMQLRNDGGPTSPRATIVAPECVNDLGSNRLGSKGLVQCQGNQDGSKQANQTRREFGVAFADFAIVYNTALEPINPENRDLSALYLGQRQVPYNLPKPLAISSEDPGTQLINYRNEPIPLRITDITPSPQNEQGIAAGGFHYRQTACALGDLKCTGDMANVFSTPAHRARDEKFASYAPSAKYSGFYEQLLENKRVDGSNKRIGIFADNPVKSTIGSALEAIEKWRKYFHCALYPEGERPVDLKRHCNSLGIKTINGPTVSYVVTNHEPWRVMGDPATPILPAFEGDPVQIRLIQGAQEAQHVFAMNGGVRWLKQPNVPNSGYVAAQPLGISEHFEFDINIAPQRKQDDVVDRMFYGSSMDQLWDGMWGLLRSFDHKSEKQSKYGLKFKALNPPSNSKVVERFKNICAATPSSAPSTSITPTTSIFRVGVLSVRELYEACGSDNAAGYQMKSTGMVFNEQITSNEKRGSSQPTDNTRVYDPDALVYVRLNEKSENTAYQELNEIKRLACTARLEPLVIRAFAGDCIGIELVNYLPMKSIEANTPTTTFVHSIHSTGRTDNSQTRGGYNHMSMITDGFNYNQMVMSHSVGLSVPLLAQDPISGDGSNIGLNGENIFVSGNQGSLLRPHDIKLPNNNYRNLTYQWYAGEYKLDDKVANAADQLEAPIEFGVVPIRSFGDVIKHTAHSLVGALVIGPEKYQVCTREQEYALLLTHDLLTAEVNADRRLRNEPDLPNGKNLETIVEEDRKMYAARNTNIRENDNGGTSRSICTSDKVVQLKYRDFVVVLQDAIDARLSGDALPNLKGAEEPDDYGAKAINYKSEPLWARRGGHPSIDFNARNESDYSYIFSSKKLDDGRCQSGAPVHQGSCDPQTPIFVAKAGREVRFRVVHPGGHTRQQSIAIAGHSWANAPFTEKSTKMFDTSDQAIEMSWTVEGNAHAVGPMMSANVLTKAGGKNKLPGDYLIRSQSSFLLDGGIWGLFRVLPNNDSLKIPHKQEQVR
jgi:manganese oxidase